jgi:hypothetical protein
MWEAHGRVLPCQAPGFNPEERVLDKTGVSGNFKICENIVWSFSRVNTKSQTGESSYYASDPSTETPRSSLLKQR